MGSGSSKQTEVQTFEQSQDQEKPAQPKKKEEPKQKNEKKKLVSFHKGSGPLEKITVN